jgi:hypothetical protein
MHAELYAPKNKFWARTINTLIFFASAAEQLLFNCYSYSSYMRHFPHSFMYIFRATIIKTNRNKRTTSNHTQSTTIVSMVLTTCGTVRVYEKHASKIFTNHRFIQCIIFLLRTYKIKFSIHFSFYILIID